MKKDLISIVTPVYNAEDFLAETIQTVLNQTYTNWELILVNDKSTDRSKEIAKPLLKDKRIKWIDLKQNSGSAIARNTAIKESNGQYICFLDADDIWIKTKLEKQLNFIKKNEYSFIYSDYEFANAEGRPNGKKVHVPKKISYNQALKNLIIWTSTVMLDMTKLDKEDIYMPNVKRGQDMATWWQILKKVDYAYGQNECLAFYRRTSNSLSANKFKALKRTWHLYRKVEKLSLTKSASCFIVYCFNAIKKRI